MNRKILTFILTSIWLLFWTSPSFALVTEYQKAVDAYKREDYKTAYKLILPLANKGFAQAQYNLGVMYEKGKGVKENLKKAKKWFQFAAEQGVVKAQYSLGLMYGKGKGVAKDYSKAIKWWNLAADQGNGKAQINLGWMYEMGKGVPKDVQKAANWYQLASNQGLAKAQEKLNLLLNKTKEHWQENTASFKEFKSLKEKSSKEIKDLQTTTASLHAELNQIKSEKAKTIEATNQANAKAKQEQLASISDNPSELNTGSLSFRGDAFDAARYSEDTMTEIGDHIINDEPDSFGSECRQLKNKDQQSECFEQFSETIAKDKIKKNYILKKNSAFNLTKKSQIAKNRNSSEVITSKDLVSKHLNKWVRAWETQDIELYLSFYSKEFKGLKERHGDWRISRQATLKKHTNISIQLKDIQISQSKDTVDIHFTQTFKSDGYSDIGVKELVWAKNGSDWRIIKETWIPHKKTT